MRKKVKVKEIDPKKKKKDVAGISKQRGHPLVMAAPRPRSGQRSPYLDLKFYFLRTAYLL